MNLNDWEFIWRRQPLPSGTLDIAALRKTFETKRQKTARILLVRDFSEATAGVFGSLVLAYFAWHMKGIVWPVLVAIALTLGVTGYFIYERIRTRRERLSPDAPLLTKVDADIRELRHQRQLLSNIWLWYLGPLVTVWTIVMVTIFLNMGGIARGEILHHPIALGFLIGYVALCIVMVWIVSHMNRRTVRRQLDPRIAELEKLRADLTPV